MLDRVQEKLKKGRDEWQKKQFEKKRERLEKAAREAAQEREQFKKEVQKIQDEKERLHGEGADSCAAGDWFDKFCDGKTVTVEKLYASSCLRTHEAPPFYSRHTERKRHRPRVQGNFQKGY